MSAAKQMQMQMIDRLAAIATCIHDDAVSAIEPCTPRHLCGFRHQVAQQRSMNCLGVRRGCDVFLGDDQ